MNENYLKYFDPELTAEEKERILREIYLDSDKRKEFEAFLKTWSYTSFAHYASDELNISEEYNLFVTRLKNSGKSNTKDRRVVPLSAVIKVAAAAILLIGLGITAYICYKPVEEIAYNEISTKKGEKAQLKLSDGTSIWLNSSSKLRYPSKLDGKLVNVYLQGEAYFDVTHSEKRLFQVHASDLNIKVLGTAFNVKSYPEEKIVETTLVRGKVRIEGKSRSEDDFVILKPNQKASYVGNHSKLVVTESTSKNLKDRSDDLPQIREIASRTNATVVLSSNVNIKYETSWKDGRLDFVDEQFGLLISKLERWYGVNISIEDPQLMMVRYTGTFEKENIEQALKALSLSLPFKYKVFKDSVTIFK